MEDLNSEFEVVVDKDDLKFNCAHFVAYNGFRERLHGHNYNVVVKLVGTVCFGHHHRILRNNRNIGSTPYNTMATLWISETLKQ